MNQILLESMWHTNYVFLHIPKDILYSIFQIRSINIVLSYFVQILLMFESYPLFDYWMHILDTNVLSEHNTI